MLDQDKFSALKTISHIGQHIWEFGYYIRQKMECKLHCQQV